MSVRIQFSIDVAREQLGGRIYGALNVKVETEIAFPTAFTTLMVTSPAALAGVVTTIEVGDTDTIVAAVPPKVTSVVPVNPVPVIVTEIPPVIGPLPGVYEVIIGGAK
jgi:hypothetical protein